MNENSPIGRDPFDSAQQRPPLLTRSIVVAAGLALALLALLQQLHAGEVAGPAALLHWLHEAALVFPVAVFSVFTSTLVVSFLADRYKLRGNARVLWALGGAASFAVATAPALELHGRHAVAHIGSGSFAQQAPRQVSVVVLVAFLFLLSVALVFGAPWEARRTRVRLLATVRRAPVLVGVTLAAALAVFVAGPAQASRAQTLAFGCTRTITADVVALDEPFYYNRLGAFNPAGMMYALRRDVVVKSGGDAGKSLAELSPEVAGGLAGNVTLRPGKRPRPLTLRVNVGDCLQINFQNLLAPSPADAEQPADRHASIHVKGMALVDPDGGGPRTAIDSDGSYVGANSSSVVAPGEFTTYKLLAQYENTFLIENMGAVTGSEATGGTASFGLFGAVNVEPFGTDWYRSQVTRVELDLAASAWIGSDAGGWTPVAEPQVDGSGNLLVRTSADGQPIPNYFAAYPSAPGNPYYERTKAGVPILAIRRGTEIVHSDLNAIVAGPPEDGYRIPHRDYPLSYWDNQIANMNSERGSEPFREFTAIFHDEIFAQQAFDLFGAPAYKHGLHSVRDGFAINYGSAGAGAEIIANRLGVGPMWNCADCKYEEFFLTSWAVGDPAMPVDVPANTKDAAGNVIPGPKATKALYPDDPSNIWDSYLNDRVKFRNLHAGPKEHHVFHLHAHQWQFNAGTKKSSYLDSQLIGPGAGFTYEIAYGGSGNRNKTVGDSIFHCHFYPHFAQGMWGLWRTHDTFERGTKLDANGRPVPGARAYPDGEIKAGTPVPAIVPLPARPMASMPNPGTGVQPYDLNGDGTADSAQVDTDGNGTADVAEKFTVAPAKNPGYPFFVAGVAGHRPPTAPLDMVDVNGDGNVEDGGLPRHVIVSGTARHFETRFDFDKELLKAKLVYVPEGGTPAEKAAMAFHSTLWQPTFLSTGARVDAATPLMAPGGRPIKGFETNGLPAVRGAPIANPCRTEVSAANNWTPAAMALDRRYKGANIQLNLVMNKMGWHFPQSRILALWDDVGATLNRTRAPEPLVMRVDAGECVEYWHTNLVPNTYELDDYQVRTPTDVIGQHIHLVKFDVLSADGSGNGFNYEDGTFSPQEVEERVDAVRAQNGCAGDDRLDAGDTWTSTCPLVRKHPVFGDEPSVGALAWGARTTAQRWYADPLLNDAWTRATARSSRTTTSGRRRTSRSVSTRPYWSSR